MSLEDVESVALPALRHRVIPGFEAVSDGISVDDILIKMISKIEKYGFLIQNQIVLQLFKK